MPPPTDVEIDHGVPVFLDQLTEALRFGLTSNAEIGRVALQHGHDLRLQGLTVSQVVHDYGDVCQSITELAVEMDAPIATRDFGTLNRCLDDAIASAVTEYGREQNQSTLDGETARASERLGFLAHELRNLANTAILSFEVLRSGNVGVAGSTGSVLRRSLMGMRTLIGRSLDEVRLAQTAQELVPIRMSAFIQEIESIARLQARDANVTLVVLPFEDGLEVRADRQILGSALTNVLQNALKFTRPHTTVTLQVAADHERVLIEVEDACGGLPSESADNMFRPFEQHSSDRTGLGLGLAYSRWAVEAHHGRIHARSLAGRGCVFTIDLPRLQLSAAPTP
jgi:signal transduction histidine kinase